MENISSSFGHANGQEGEKRKLSHTPTSLSEPKRTKRKIIKTLTDKNTRYPSRPSLCCNKKKKKLRVF